MGSNWRPDSDAGLTNARMYVARVNSMKAVFARLAAEESPSASPAQYVISQR